MEDTHRHAHTCTHSESSEAGTAGKARAHWAPSPSSRANLNPSTKSTKLYWQGEGGHRCFLPCWENKYNAGLVAFPLLQFKFTLLSWVEKKPLVLHQFISPFQLVCISGLDKRRITHEPPYITATNLPMCCSYTTANALSFQAFEGK